MRVLGPCPVAPTLAATIIFALALPTAEAAPKLIGSVSIPGTAIDLSGLSDKLEEGTPHNILGGFGSAITYSGAGNRYIATPDRGPADGTTRYACRYHVFEIDIATSGSVAAKLVQTTLLTNEKGERLVGSAAAFDAGNPPASLRFDPEGARVAANGNLFVSDEYGPFIYEFNPEGRRLRALNVPVKFLVNAPSADGAKELPPANTSGRQANRGMEGLALAPGSGRLYGIMQSPLIQDGGLDAANKRVGTNVRILEIDPATNATREFLYPLDAAGNGISEITAINDTEFLVIERDGRVGAEAKVKQIHRIDITGATDISSATLPQTGIPNGVTPVKKSRFIDMLDPSYGLAGASFPEKPEALAFGPTLSDGRLLLLVGVDNDLAVANPSTIYAFAIDPAELPNYKPFTR